jgi:hypothetical protein
MKAVILCDDFAFAAKANATLRRVGYQAGVEVQWIIKCWPVNALNDAVLAETALAEALDAHLILLPARRAQSLTAGLLDWFERWATLRRIPAAALGVLNEGNATDLIKSVCPELSRFIRRHHLNFILDGRGATQDAVQLLIGFSRERTVSIPIERSFSVGLSLPSTFREYGINE